MSRPQRLPDEYLATLPEDHPRRQAQEALDRARAIRLELERRQHQDGPLVRAARAIERALSPRRF
jgi:hypothetical protein